MLKYDYQSGTKGTLIFVHGAGGNRSKWRRQMAALPEGFGGLAVDLTGHGESIGEAPTEINDYANDIIQCIQEISPVRPLIWTGHSLGGGIVLSVALLKPDLVDYLVLIGTGGRLRVAPDTLASLKKGIIDPAAKRLNYSPSTPEDLIDEEIAADIKTDPQITYHAMLACDKFDVLNQLPSIKRPALIIVGKDDLSTPPKYAEFMLNKLPQASLSIIEKAGHMVMLEQPAAVNDSISRFLKENILS